MLRSSPVEYERSGSGEPLLLIHGIGMTRGAWNPVVPLLRAHREVIAWRAGARRAARGTPAR